MRQGAAAAMQHGASFDSCFEMSTIEEEQSGDGYKRKRVEIETDFLVTSFICGWPLSHALYIYL